MVALVLFTCAAGARPLLVPPQNLDLPRPWVPQIEGEFAHIYHGVAIDGGTLLVSAQRAINPQYDRVDGVYIFERNAAGRWAYAGVLTEQWSGAVWLNGTVAAINAADGIKVFERGAAGWALTGTIAVQYGYVFRIDDGSIYVRQEGPFGRTCESPYQQFRKVSGIWTQVATIGGQRCDQNDADINDGRAIVVHTPLGSSDSTTSRRDFRCLECIDLDAHREHSGSPAESRLCQLVWAIWHGSG